MSQLISGEIDLDKLIDTLMRIALEHAGATRGLLILPQQGELRIEAEGTIVRDTVEVRRQHSPPAPSELPESVLRSVVRTRESILLADAAERNPFSDDDYIRRNRPRSILCIPLIKQTALVGVLYLENGRAAHVFD